MLMILFLCSCNLFVSLNGGSSSSDADSFTDSDRDSSDSDDTSDFSNDDDDNSSDSSDSVSVTNACNFDSVQCTHWFDGSDINNLYSDGSCTTNVTSDGDLARCWKNLGSDSTDQISRAGGFTGEYNISARSIGGLSAYYIEGSANQAAFFTSLVPQVTGTWFFVLKVHNVSGGQDTIIGNAAAGPTSETSLAMNNSGELSFTHGDNTVTYNSTNLIGTEILVTVVFESGNFSLYLDGNLVGTSAQGTTDSTYAFGVGSLYYGSVANGADTSIGEMAFYSTALDEDEREAIEAHLTSKWSL